MCAIDKTQLYLCCKEASKFQMVKTLVLVVPSFDFRDGAVHESKASPAPKACTMRWTLCAEHWPAVHEQRGAAAKSCVLLPQPSSSGRHAAYTNKQLWALLSVLCTYGVNHKWHRKLRCLNDVHVT